MLNSPIHFAHHIWAQHLQEQMVAIDATCGNGKDSLFLAERLVREKNGTLYCMDIQSTAIKATKDLLSLHVNDLSHIHFLLSSHEKFPMEGPIHLIVYNLGYLPGADKSITTRGDSTIKSLHHAMSLLAVNGLISLTCYPGHAEGAKEAQRVLELVKQLDKRSWLALSTAWINRDQAPFTVFIKKIV